MSLNRLGVDGIDGDGDGVPDAGWSFAGSPSGRDSATFIDDGRVLAITSLQVPGVGERDALVIASLALPVNEICQGERNSSGVRCSLRAVGTDLESFDDLDLRVTDLPHTSLVLPLVSRTSGFVANPGGSFGSLCLAGSIGRGTPLSGGHGVNLTLPIYLNSLAQPGGAVAAQAGGTWYWQIWYRDAQMGTAGSNFSSAIGVTFR